MCAYHNDIGQEKNYNALRKFFSRLPPRPSGPPTLVQSEKRWGSWFLFSIVFVLVGALTKRGSLQGLIGRLFLKK